MLTCMVDDISRHNEESAFQLLMQHPLNCMLLNKHQIIIHLEIVHIRVKGLVMSVEGHGVLEVACKMQILSQEMDSECFPRFWFGPDPSLHAKVNIQKSVPNNQYS